LATLLKESGVYGVPAIDKMSAADAAFMTHERLPRSLHDISPAALFAADQASSSPPSSSAAAAAALARVNTFGLLADDVERAAADKAAAVLAQ
jgi:hypothetical protein